MNLVNNFFSPDNKTPISKESSCLSNRSSKIIAIFLIIISLFVTVGLLITSIITGNPLLAIPACVGALLLAPAVLLLLKTRKKIKTLFKFSQEQTRKYLNRLFPNRSKAEHQLTVFFSSNRSSLKLCFSHCPIHFPVILIKDEKKAIVFNSANPNLDPGGIGTNAVLSSAVTTESWNSTRLKHTPVLQEGDVTTGIWVSSAKYTQDRKRHGKPDLSIIWSSVGNPWTHLGQILIPKPKDHNNTPSSAFPILKKAYLKAIEQALHLECELIQFPAFYCEPHISEEWRTMSLQALLESIVEAEKQLQKDPKKKLILNRLRIAVADENHIDFKKFI